VGPLPPGQLERHVLDHQAGGAADEGPARRLHSQPVDHLGAATGRSAIGARSWPGAPPRYFTYTRVDCAWGEPLRIDVLSRNAAVMTAMFRCEKADTSGATWVENAARTGAGAGLTSEGLPVGLMICGPRFSEGRLLALGAAHERSTEWHKRRPESTGR
jgi:hypothetical protein